jgi:nucleoside-diphosphate-sugar epimerase
VAHSALPPDDPKVRRPDISLARRVLGWEPQVSPDEGLAKMLPYFKSQLERAKS